MSVRSEMASQAPKPTNLAQQEQLSEGQKAVNWLHEILIEAASKRIFLTRSRI